MDLSQATDQLLAAPWESFVETRTRLADELAQAGRREDSRALKKVRRPTAAAWATNQLVRRSRPAVDAYLAASDQLRDRQAAMLEGGGDRAAYQAAAETFRQATASLTQSIRQVLQQGGREPDRTQVEGVLANVRAAALAQGPRQDRRAELLAGRLLADLPASEGALDDVFGASVAAGAAATAPVSRVVVGAGRPHTAANDTHAAHGARHAGAHAKGGGEDAGRDHAQARREAEARARREEHARRVAVAREDERTAREAAATATEGAEQARRAREAAEEELAGAEAALAKARDALADAKTALHAAERAAKERQVALDRATAHRHALEKQSPP